MPLTGSLVTRTSLTRKGEGKIHTAKWHSCWEKVQAQGKSSESAAAICTDAIGGTDSIQKKHRRKKADYAAVLKGK